MATITPQPEDRWQTIRSIWKQNQWLYVIAGFLLGLLFFPFVQLVIADLATLLGNLVPEAISTLIAVFVIDRIYRRHADKERLQELITQMRSDNNSLAQLATNILREKGWLYDGKLRGAQLNDANLRRAELSEADLREAHLDYALLEGARLVDTHLERAKLRLAHLEGANLPGAYLTDADLRSANLAGANLAGARLENLNLVSVRLENTILVGAHLEGADLTCVHLEGADLQDVHLEGATLKGAYLQGANLKNANFSENTVLPDGTFWTPDPDRYLPDEPNTIRFTDPTYPGFREDYCH